MKSQCAFSVDSAIDLLLQLFQFDRKQIGLAAVSSNESPAKRKLAKQTSMKSFCAPKKAAASS